MAIYFIPGLGFDDRIFRNLTIENQQLNYINWIDPLVDESIQSYAKRLSTKIDTKNDDIILIGHSFGGIICQEIASILSVKKVILISSIKNSHENPLQFKLMKFTGIYKLFTKGLTSSTIKFWGSSQDYKTKEEQALVKDMVNKQSNNYLQWALKQLSIWQEPEYSKKNTVVHIHGERDKTFPISLIKKPFHTIKNGGHFMVYRNAKPISTIINKKVKSIS